MLTLVDSSETEVNVVADGRASAGAGDVVLIADTGAIVTEPSGWTYEVAPSIDAVSPGSGQVGTRVTLTGVNMLGGGSAVQSLTLAGVEVSSVDFANATVIEVTVTDSTAATGDVVLISDTGARVVAVAGWEYLENGVISSVTPNLGQEQSEVQIAGARLLGGGSSASVVTLAGLSATIRSSSATVVEVYAARSPVATVGAVVIVADTGAIVTLADGWQYLEPGDITSVSPSSGQEGTEVTIDGSKLLASGTVASRVTLLGIAATVVRSNGTQVVVTAAASTSTEVVVGDVAIISDTGVLVTEVNGFTYHPNGFIANLEPTAGVLGSSVFIYGQQLRGYGQSVATVTLDGVAATIVQETNFFALPQLMRTTRASMT